MAITGYKVHPKLIIIQLDNNQYIELYKHCEHYPHMRFIDNFGGSCGEIRLYGMESVGYMLWLIGGLNYEQIDDIIYQYVGLEER